MPELNASEWDVFLHSYPEAHLLQTAAWGELKAAFGWDVLRLAVEAPEVRQRLGAQVLFRRLPLGFSLAYIPKGPVGGDFDHLEGEGWRRLWAELDKLCRQRRAVFLKVEPDLWEMAQEGQSEGEHLTRILPFGLLRGQHGIQPARTVVVDLQGDEEQVLSRMKQKTRYNIRLALKKGVVVSPSDDIDTFFRLMRLTGERDAFGFHSLAYYRKAYELFHPTGGCELLVAAYEGEPLAALMVFRRGSRAWYFYGASANEHRDRMPTYLLQWEAMRWARQSGCLSYDLWGVPDFDEATLESNFTRLSAGLWGVYRFKRGFGGQLLRSAGPWDRVYQPFLYNLYCKWAARRGREL
ncbi:MAG: peptidoglycan bridge formation glycyltransferase FemA/FemB family protein [Anaerolineales bacterium]|nr:peptidoglycan bridge formation glycyltransferase FemA/FemB family protein [Anaerolineales bacterium]